MITSASSKHSRPTVAASISPLLRFLLSVMLSVTAPPVLAQGIGGTKVCPGFIGQPETRKNLISEYICIPSLANPPGTPAELNRTCFIRIHQSKPVHEMVDAVIFDSNVTGGGSTANELPAQIVEMAALQGKNIEVWNYIHRFANLNDTRGLMAAAHFEDPNVALNYYFGDTYLGADGRFNGVLGGPGARFTPLQQSDVPFMADWGADVVYRDLETLLNLIPKQQRSAHVFLMANASNSSFLTQFAGFRLLDGNRAYQELAGLIPIEGVINTLGAPTGPTSSDLANYFALVEAIRAGTAPRFTTFTGVGLDPTGTSGIGALIARQIMALSAIWDPTRESIFLPLRAGAVGGPLADQFTGALRLTNRAREHFPNAFDPLPGGFLGLVQGIAGRDGYLDFTPLPGSAICAAPGPFGMVPPCVPSATQINPTSVYDWRPGGSGGSGAPGNPLSGWTIVGGAFSSALVNPLENPSSITYNEASALPGTRTNNQPVRIDFPVSGPQTIDSSFKTIFNWYVSNRYAGTDVAFINKFQKVNIDRPDLGIELDIDKTGVNIPLIQYTNSAAGLNPWPSTVDDFTLVNRLGTTQTPLAAQRSPFDPAINTRLYNNVDIHTADNSRGAEALAGTVIPGDVGANPISDTLTSWIAARIGPQGVAIPDFPTHITCRPLDN